MILLQVITKEIKQAEEIIKVLLKKNMLLEATIQENVSSKKIDKKGNVISISKTLITGKTKALLFNEIDSLIKRKFKKNPPVLYATPIVQMDWEQSRNLLDNVAKV